MRKAKALQRISTALMADPFGRHYGYPLSRSAHVRSGTMYLVLDSMLRQGWVAAAWEEPAELTAKRPRRYYVLTDKGRTSVVSLLEKDAEQ